MNHKDEALCSACKGQCCKNMPGICLPEDFDHDYSKVKETLKGGRYAIDWWEDDIPVYYIRPALKGKEGKLLDPAWSGTECTFLEEKGCTLSLEARPAQCRQLEPAKPICIEHIGNKLVYAKQWDQEKIQKLISCLKGERG